MGRVNLAELNPKETRELLFDTNAALHLVVRLVRENTKPDWAVRKKVEEALMRYVGKVEPHFDRTAARQVSEDRDRAATDRRRAYWAELEDGDRSA